MNERSPLCVDLDGSLVKTDTLHQGLFLLLRRRPAVLFRLPGLLARGRAALKAEIARLVPLDPAVLPYNRPLLDFLRTEKKNGRRLVLATAADRRTAKAIAEHLGLFDEILASDGTVNLRGKRKLDLLRERFGRFAYVGNDAADIPLLEAAEEIYLANPTASVRRRFADRAAAVFDDRRPHALLRALRPRQWLKNLLVFAPAFLAHRLTEPDVFLRSLAAFASFSLAASSIYILNDLFDLSADQHHPRKRNRPFAAGDLSVPAGLLLVPLLAAGALLLGFLLPPAFLGVLVLYYFLTTLYSWKIKQLAVVDVLLLAVLYAMRLVAGAAATGVAVSAWLIIFALFLFLSLALVKRLSELRELAGEQAADSRARERGYRAADLPLLLAFGTASGYLSALVLAMYLNSDKVTELYRRPQLLWILCPILLYWITRVWLLAWRGKMHDDPLAFAARDVQTYLLGLLGIATVLLAI